MKTAAIERSEDSWDGKTIVNFMVIFLSERLAHPPLGAGAGVDHGVEVVITGNHVNRTAPSSLSDLGSLTGLFSIRGR